MRRSLPLLIVLLSAGCAATEPQAPATAVESTSASGGQTAAKRRRTYVAGEEAEAEAPPLTANPYAERPGAEEETDPGPEPRATVFDAPVGEARRPVPVAERDALRVPARIAVVFVRQGEIVHDAEELLALERLLEKNTEVRSVLALRELPTPRADLAALSKQAKREGDDLLVALVRPGADDPNGEAFVVHTPRGDLLLVTALGAEKVPTQPTSSDADVGLLAQITDALWRLQR